ncbi:hypothetical protein GUJ93_ZPchr0001g31925 [Zizania palustris]|uniref:Uncharacterized protein n=1 Tax=Zizania palustris TaxID=103762 RepID=A0A8J5RPJ2_ZIZPA|nr:hypothetical protein GUJ93_ZPchr0001g31925 [Zizania palustris]
MESLSREGANLFPTKTSKKRKQEGGSADLKREGRPLLPPTADLKRHCVRKGRHRHAGQGKATTAATLSKGRPTDEIAAAEGAATSGGGGGGGGSICHGDLGVPTEVVSQCLQIIQLIAINRHGRFSGSD